MAAVTGAVIAAGSAALSFSSARKDQKSREKANDTAQRQRDESIDFIRQQTETARGDIFKLFPEAQKSRQQGIQSGLDVFRQSVPLQRQLFQQGGLGAQNALIQGQRSAQSAILGQPTNFNPQPVQIGGGLGFDVPNAPQFAPIQGQQQQQLQQQIQQQQQLTPEQIQQIQQLGL